MENGASTTVVSSSLDSLTVAARSTLPRYCTCAGQTLCHGRFLFVSELWAASDSSDERLLRSEVGYHYSRGVISSYFIMPLAASLAFHPL